MTKKLEALEEGPKAKIRIDLLKTTMKISNWKILGHDGIRDFWFKWFTSIHDWQALEMNRCLHRAHTSERKDHIDRKVPKQWTALNNYRPINCQPIMWKILIAQIMKEIYYSLTSRGLFPDELKGCRKGSRDTVDLLYIDQHILNEGKTRRKNLARAWID